MSCLLSGTGRALKSLFPLLKLLLTPSLTSLQVKAQAPQEVELSAALKDQHQHLIFLLSLKHPSGLALKHKYLVLPVEHC